MRCVWMKGNMMKAYKLFEVKKDGSLGSLFIDKRSRYELGIEYKAGDYTKKGFAHRPGFHACSEPSAPHIKERDNRVWYVVELGDVEVFKRPKCQGGIWYLSDTMTLIARL